MSPARVQCRVKSYDSRFSTACRFGSASRNWSGVQSASPKFLEVGRFGRPVGSNPHVEKNESQSPTPTTRNAYSYPNPRLDVCCTTTPKIYQTFWQNNFSIQTKKVRKTTFFFNFFSKLVSKKYFPKFQNIILASSRSVRSDLGFGGWGLVVAVFCQFLSRSIFDCTKNQLFWGS